MKKVKTTQGRAYVVTAATVPCRISSNGIELALVETVGQVSFVAIEEEIDVDQDDAVITPVFKGARLGLSAKGGVKEFYITVDGLTLRTHNNRKLINGTFLFYNSTQYEIVVGDEPFTKLRDGTNMFYKARFAAWTAPLPALVNGGAMFQLAQLPSFSSPLPLLEIGWYMFSGCQLTEWLTPLPSLTSGSLMFDGCKLNKPSVLIILNSLPTRPTNSVMTIGAAKACEGDPEIAAAITSAQARGWTFQISYNA